MHTPSLKRAGTLLFIGTGQFLFFFSLAEIYYPGYDVSTDPLSDLGAACRGGVCTFVHPSSEIFNATTALLGLILILSAYYFWKGSGSGAYPLFVALAGVGALGVGVFNESYGEVHVFFSALTFVSAGIQALLVYRVASAPFYHFSAFAGVVTLVATLLYGTETYLGLGQGGMERMVVYPVLVSAIAMGGHLMGRGEVGSR